VTGKARLRIAGALAAVAAVIAFTAGRGTTGAPVPLESRKTVPKLKLPDIGGNTWRLSDHKGRVVLVNFWATWCPPCRYETPDLVEVYQKYESRGFTAVGIAMDEEGPQVVRKFIDKYRIPYPIVLPGDSGVGSSIESLPTTLLIDKHGRVAHIYNGMVNEARLARDVERLLAENLTASPPPRSRAAGALPGCEQRRGAPAEVWRRGGVLRSGGRP